MASSLPEVDMPLRARLAEVRDALAAAASSPGDSVRRLRAEWWLGVVLLVGSTLQLPLGIAVHGVSSLTPFLAVIPFCFVAVIVLAGRGHADVAALVLVVVLAVAITVPVVTTDDLSTWPLGLPVVALVYLLVLPLRWWPAGALVVLLIALVMYVVARAGGSPTVSTTDVTRDAAFATVVVLGIAVVAASSIAGAERSARAALTLAERDALTGLGNRRAEERLSALMACQVGEGEPVAVAMIDVDGFKGVNDRLGHDTGDAVLVEVAQVLTDGSRHADHLLRHGGDEFLLVMPGTTPPEAHAVCERLRRTVHQHAWAAGPGWQPAPTISVGIAAIDASTGWLDAVDRADQQLLLAKAAGRNQVRPRTEPATTG